MHGQLGQASVAGREKLPKAAKHQRFRTLIYRAPYNPKSKAGAAAKTEPTVAAAAVTATNGRSSQVC